MSRAAALFAMAVCALVSQASADIVANFLGQGGRDSATVSLYNQDLNTVIGSNTSSGGPMLFNVTSNPTNLLFRTADGGSSTSAFVGFCAEITETGLSANPHTLTLIDLANAPDPGSNNNPMGAFAANLIKNMWYQHFSSTIGDTLKTAAFQMAMWELIYDEGVIDLVGPLNTPAGVNQFRAGDSDVRDQAQLFLTGLDANGPKANLYALTKYDSSGKTIPFQDQIVEIVPEPASILGWSLIGGCFVVGHRIRRSRMIVA
jgi:hypothetical protein